MNNKISETFDSLIVSCNEAVSAMTRGEYIKWCSIMVLMVQELGCLKEDVARAMDEQNKTIAGLKALNEEDAHDA